MQSDLWAQKRKQRLDIDKHECRTCGCKDRLEVHHKPDSYRKIPNESLDDDLTTLCVWCHDLITNRIREMRYENRPIVTEAHSNTSIPRKGNNYVEDIEIPPHRSLPGYSAQR